MSKVLKVIAGVSLLWLFQGSVFAEDVPPPPSDKPNGIIDKADSNKDGKVTYDEFKAAREVKMQENFNKLDADGDGAVDKAEEQKAREARREKRHERRPERRDDRKN